MENISSVNVMNANVINMNNMPNMQIKNRGLWGEFWDYLKVRKKWWLAPIIFVLLLIAILIIFGQSSILSPFIYSLF